MEWKEFMGQVPSPGEITAGNFNDGPKCTPEQIQKMQEESRRQPVQILPIPKPIQGVGVLHYPAQGLKVAKMMAEDMADSIHQGAILFLPNDKDEHGNYLWDFRIEGGDPGQVIIKRQDEP